MAPVCLRALAACAALAATTLCLHGCGGSPEDTATSDCGVLEVQAGDGSAAWSCEGRGGTCNSQGEECQAALEEARAACCGDPEDDIAWMANFTNATTTEQPPLVVADAAEEEAPAPAPPAEETAATPAPSPAAGGGGGKKKKRNRGSRGGGKNRQPNKFQERIECMAANVLKHFGGSRQKHQEQQPTIPIAASLGQAAAGAPGALFVAAAAVAAAMVTAAVSVRRCRRSRRALDDAALAAPVVELRTPVAV